MGSLLIVDDEVLAVEGLKKALWGKVPGIDDILVALEVAQAQRLFETHRIDVVVTDIEMAGESGLDLLAWLADHHPDTKPIVLSCHPNFPYVQQALRLRSFDYLLKPIPAKELIEVIGRALGTGPCLPACPPPELPPPSTTADSAGSIAGPDLGSWGLLMRSGAYDRVRFEVLSYLRKQPCAVQKRPDFLRLLILDFQQLVYAQLQAKGIPAHQMLKDERAAELMTRAAQDPGDLALWMEHILSYLERASLDVDQKETPFGRACDYIARHITENLYCEQIADHVAVNQDYLSHLFKKRTNLSVNQYIIREKMKVAAGLLVSTQLPVCNIASGLGYANFSHFSQSFKKCFEVCPADYRAVNVKTSQPAVTENR
jgi:YesN/AraC family two-component response regulator